MKVQKGQICPTLNCFHSFSFSYLSFLMKNPQQGLVNQVGGFSFLFQDNGILVAAIFRNCGDVCVRFISVQFETFTPNSINA